MTFAFFQTGRGWYAAVIGSALFFAILIQIPQWIHMRDARFQGVLVQLNSDEDVYLARVEEALTGRPEQSAEAFIGDPHVRGSQPALLERAIGTLFAPTHWRAATVVQVMDSITIFVLLLLLVWFLRQCGFSRVQSITGGILFCVLQLYNLNRPIHQGLSFLLLLAALNCLIAGRERRVLAGVAGGVLLGALFGDYFWNWSFGWLWVVLLLVWEAADALRSRRLSLEPIKLLLFSVLGCIVAFPFLWELLSVLRDPLSAEAVFRSGMHLSRLPESVPYSILFTLMAAGIAVTITQSPERFTRYRYAAVTVLTSFMVMHQQVIHGRTFNFVSHYLLALVFSAILTVWLWYVLRGRAMLVAAIAASAYLVLLAYDGRNVFSQFTVTERFSEQHFASLLPVLDALPRATILSDPASSAFIAGSTHHDVVYSVYLKNVLLSHRDIAERYCASVFAVAPDDRHLEQQLLIWPDANGAFHDPAIRQREIQLVQEACERQDKNPRQIFSNFGVQYVLWDEQRQPAWNLQRPGIPFTKTASGDGWSLWSVGNPS